MKLLDSVHSPEDVRKLSEEDLPILCEEIRNFLVDKVSATGGHLASSLGVVELTVAIHRVFDTSVDRLIFDVGHQCYVHKLLTGRKEGFDSLRTLGGMSGFPKPNESIHDAFIAGHASNSVSIALGFARADQIAGRKRHVLALIGDGALSGGLATEGLYDAGVSGLPLIIILNDNGMSINNNVGGMAQYLARTRLTPKYRKAKERYRKIMNALPGGKAVYRFTSKMKDRLKRSVLNCSMFEELGLRYGGPVDGHDVKRLEEVLQWAIDQNAPTLIHVHTIKGKGYPYAEENPDKFHGISAFDPKTGIAPLPKPDFSAAFGKELCFIAKENKSVCAITAAMTEGTGLQGFSVCNPNRFFDVGITEGHAAAMAAGLAAGGMIPVLAVYSTFLQRSYDMLLHDVAIMGNHVVLAVDRAGLVGRDGETHHGLFDVSYLSSIPGMTIYAPASFAELRYSIQTAVQKDIGPVAVRYPRGGEGAYQTVEKTPVSQLRSGDSAIILTYGISINDTLEAADRLAEEGIFVSVLKLLRIFPLPVLELLPFFKGGDAVLVVEEAAENGCIGQKLSAALSENGCSCRLKLLNTGNGFVPHGSVEELRHMLGLDADGIEQAVKELMDIG